MFRFSDHALEQLRIRGLEMERAVEVLKNPQQRINQENLTIFQSIVHEHKQKYLVRIFVNLHKVPPLVVTIYKTSKINKYWHEN